VRSQEAFLERVQEEIRTMLPKPILELWPKAP